MTSDPRGRTVFQKLAEEEKEHLGTLEQRYARAHRRRIRTLESRPTFLFFKGAANGIFAEGAEKLRAGVDDLQALLIGIRCERDSHKFFKKYGERFEDSEGKQIFLEFADEERAHRDLLIAEYRALRERLAASPRRRRSPRRASQPIDRSPHPHDGLRRPVLAGGTGGACRARQVSRRSASPITTPSPDAPTRPPPARDARIDVRPGHRDDGGRRATRDVHVLGYFVDHLVRVAASFLAEQRQRRVDRVREMIARLDGHGITLDAEAILAPGLDRCHDVPSAGPGSPARWSRRATSPNVAKRSIGGSRAAARPLCPASAPTPKRCSSRIHDAGGIASLAHPVLIKHDEWIPGFAEAGLDALEVVSQPTTTQLTTAQYLALAHDAAVSASPAAPTIHADTAHGGGDRAACRCRSEHYERLLAPARRPAARPRPARSTSS